MLRKVFHEIEEHVRKETRLDWTITGGFFMPKEGDGRVVIEWALKISDGLSVTAMSSGGKPTLIYSVRMEGNCVQNALCVLQDKAKETSCV